MERIEALYAEALKYDSASMALDAAGWAEARGWLEPADDKENDLVQFLESEVQCLHMQAAKAYRAAPDGNKVRAMRIENLCRDAGSSEGLEAVRTQLEVSADAQARLRSMLAEQARESIQNRLALDTINAALSADFEVRRAMLLKRCDVTIQSFLWGDAAKGQESEIVAAIEAMRQSLQKQPTPVTVDDALILSRGGLDALRSRLNEKSLLTADDAIKKTLIGEVPNRGGQAKQASGRKSAGPAWTDRQSGGGGRGGQSFSGGRKGGRRGGGGGGNNKRARSG